jgi:hypothetical protein
LLLCLGISQALQPDYAIVVSVAVASYANRC